MADINEYKSNLELCSSKLMNLLNGLQEQTSLDENVSSIPGSMTFQACDIFNWIKRELVGECPNQNGILDDICDALKSILCSDIVKNCELRKQLIRALKLCECLSQAIRHTNCDDDLGGLVGRLFCLLVQIVLLVIAIIAKIIILLIFCRGNCGNFFGGCNNGEVLSAFCKCLICDLEKELDDIEKLIDELNKIAIIFVTHSSKKCDCNKNHLNYDDYQDYTNYNNFQNHNNYDNFNGNDNSNYCDHCKSHKHDCDCHKHDNCGCKKHDHDCHKPDDCGCKKDKGCND